MSLLIISTIREIIIFSYRELCWWSERQIFLKISWPQESSRIILFFGKVLFGSSKSHISRRQRILLSKFQSSIKIEIKNCICFQLCSDNNLSQFHIEKLEFSTRKHVFETSPKIPYLKIPTKLTKQFPIKIRNRQNLNFDQFSFCLMYNNIKFNHT